MLIRVGACVGLLFCDALFASASRYRVLPLGNLRLEVPAAWSLVQMATSGDQQVFSLRKGEESITVFYRPQTGLRIDQFIASDAARLSSITEPSVTSVPWSRSTTSKKANVSAAPTVFVNHFLVENQGATYHGFSRASSAEAASRNADEILNAVSFVLPLAFKPFSLTDASYTGKKFYLGWGAAASSDPANMQNEVKYDVLHTNAIFTTDLGGNYADNKLIGFSNATAKAIRQQWQQIGRAMDSEDMYLQYSSGHGSETGLGVGVSYEEIRDNALAYPAKEVVILIMACHSGALVDSFNKVKSKWQDWSKSGRSLLVMASSDAYTNSEVGPGKDPSEPNGPSGSAGSAFGHAVWKALTGSADGFSDGVVDGYISLGELRDYARYRTKQVGGHTPVDTGTYLPYVIMNRVPSASYLAHLRGGTDGLSDAQIEEAIAKLDRDLSLDNK